MATKVPDKLTASKGLRLRLVLACCAYRPWSRHFVPVPNFKTQLDPNGFIKPNASDTVAITLKSWVRFVQQLALACSVQQLCPVLASA